VNGSRTWYVNPDFDLGLRPRPAWTARPGLVRQVRELSAQALLGAEEGDAALLRVPVAGEFLDYLRRRGIPAPRVLAHPAVDPATELRPFGWSAEAMDLNRRHRAPAAHPEPGAIERVNARSFARDLEAELDPEGPAGTVVEAVDALERFLSGAPKGSEWVVKAEHGNAGLANRRLPVPALSEADRRFAGNALAEDDRLVVEPWLPRERDWCAIFEVPFDPASFRVHEMSNTRDGALIGARFEAGAASPEGLPAVAERVASKLEREGYFGPACVDAFTWRDGDRLRLRPLVDLNCRRSMSDGAYRLWRRTAPDRVLYYRFFNRRKLTLPSALAPAVKALAEHGFEPSRRRGVLLASPPAHAKLAVIFAAEDRPGVLHLERWFRSRFEG